MDVMQGRRAVPLSEVAHIIVPGRGRSADGMTLSTKGLERALYTVRVWSDLKISDKDGIIVTCGNKSPADIGGRDDLTPNNTATHIGVPEADLLAREICSKGIPDQCIRAERYSIDSTTNLANVENGGYLPDNRPVAIVAQAAHLNRIIKYIAPKTMRRDYIGVIVPENLSDRDRDGSFATLASRAILFGLTPDTPNIERIAYRRATLLWDMAIKLHLWQNYNVDKFAK